MRFATSQKTTVPPPAIARAKEFIRRNFAEELSLRRISAAAGVSPPYLNKLFQKHLEATPMKYVWGYRLERSSELLQETGLSISEISFQTGFQNPFHFSRLFKAKYDMPPRQFRERSWRCWSRRCANGGQKSSAAPRPPSASNALNQKT
jgi:AraC family transcriptional regulator of arabinose operon